MSYRFIINRNSTDSVNGEGLVYLKNMFPYLSITGVIIGSKLDIIKRKKILNICKDRNIIVYEAKCAIEKYEMNISLLNDNEIYENKKEKFI